MSVHDMSDYFEKTEQVMREKGILRSWVCGIWMRQAFGLAMGKLNWLLLWTQMRVECISSAGEPIPPMLFMYCLQ